MYLLFSGLRRNPTLHLKLFACMTVGMLALGFGLFMQYRKARKTRDDISEIHKFGRIW